MAAVTLILAATGGRRNADEIHVPSRREIQGAAPCRGSPAAEPPCRGPCRTKKPADAHPQPSRSILPDNHKPTMSRVDESLFGTRTIGRNGRKTMGTMRKQELSTSVISRADLAAPDDRRRRPTPRGASRVGWSFCRSAHERPRVRELRPDERQGRPSERGKKQACPTFDALLFSSVLLGSWALGSSLCSLGFPSSVE